MLDIATALGEEEKGHVLVQSLRTRAGGKNVTGQVRRRAEVTASVCLMSVHCDGLDSRAGAFCVETTLNIGPVDLFETVKQVKECGR